MCVCVYVCAQNHVYVREYVHERMHTCGGPRMTTIHAEVTG